MTVNERLIFLVKTLANGNKLAFAEAIGIKSGTIGDLVGGRLNKPSFGFLEKLVIAYPQVRLDWLVKGEGEPFIIQEQRPQLVQQVKQKNSNNGVLIATQTLENVVTVPMVNIKAAANYVSGYQTQEYFETLEATIMPKTVTRGQHGIWLQIDGDSMQPTYFDKQWVLGTYIEKGKWKDTKDSEAYIVVSEKHGIQVKRIKNRLDEGFIRCRSDNRKNHPPFSIYRADILEIWRVAAYLTNYMPNLGDELYWKVDHVEEQQQDLRVMYEHMQIELLEIKKQLKK